MQDGQQDREQARTKKRLLLYGGLSVAMMAVIFAFSSMDGTLSTSQSNSVAYWLAGQLIEGFSSMSEVQKLEAIHGMTYPIRKAAHITEYAILGGLLTVTWWQAFKLKATVSHVQMKCWGSAFLCAVGYACSDEFHQLFTPGRTGQPIDVCIDSIGILVGSAIVIWSISSGRERGESR